MFLTLDYILQDFCKLPRVTKMVKTRITTAFMMILQLNSINGDKLKLI